MSTDNLSTLMTGTVENGRTASKNLIQAYRRGGTRFVRQVDRRIERARIADVLARQVEATSARAEQVVDVVYDGAAAAIDKVTELFGRLENAYVARYLEPAGEVGLRGARAMRRLTGQLARESEKLVKAPARRRAPTRKAAAKRASRRKASA